MRMMKAMIEQTAGLRRPGAAALDLAYVAAGFYDGFWEVGLNAWDVAAGSLLIQEAGGLIGDLAGDGEFLHGGQVIAATPKIFAQMVTALAPFRAELVRERSKKAPDPAPERTRPRGARHATHRRPLPRRRRSASGSPATSSLAQEYPTKPIRIIVPFAAGGPADVYARFIGVRLQEALGQPVVVEDRPGAGSIIGTDAVAKSAPDGYTLLMMSNTQTVNETLIPNKPYQLMRDFVPVAPVNYSDLVLVVHPSVGANSVADLIRIAKASPGQAQLRVVRSRHAVPHGRRALQGDGGRGHRPRSVQGQLRRADRRPRRAGADDVRRRADDERAREERTREGARHDRQGALLGAAQRPDDRRGRRAGLRSRDLARPHGAERHAACDRRASSTPRSRRSRTVPKSARSGRARARCRCR